MEVPLDELIKPLLVKARHVGDIDEPVALEVAGLMAAPFHDAVLARHWLKLHHGEIAASVEVAVLVKHIGDAAGHAGGEVPPRRADHHHDAARHIFAAMVARAFYHRGGAGIAHGKALAANAPEVALTGDRAIEHGIADDDRGFRHDAR